MSKRPKLAYDDQQTTANNNDFFSEETSSEVHFEYTGSDHQVPDYVTHVRVHPSVTKIDDAAFHSEQHLKEVILSEGLVEIGSDVYSLVVYHCKRLIYPLLLSRLAVMHLEAVLGLRK